MGNGVYSNADAINFKDRRVSGVGSIMEGISQDITGMEYYRDSFKDDTDTKMNDLKVSLEKGYKKISELSNKELDELILTYRQDVKNLENKLIYKKSLL